MSKIVKIILNKSCKCICSVCRESSVHGLPLVVKKSILMFERIFWLICIVISILAMTKICLDQLNRYHNHATMLSIQTDFRNWRFQKIGVTLCFDRTYEISAKKVVKNTWNVTEHDSRFQYYLEFTKTIASTKYYNLEQFHRYTNDSELAKANMLEIAMKVHHFMEHEYKLVVNEMGVCVTATVDDTQYRPIDMCTETITPPQSHVLNDIVTVYLHEMGDVISASDTTMARLTLKQIYLMDVHLKQTVAVNELRRLSPNTRKCYFRDEHPFQPNFWNYTPNLYKKYQRIKAAVRLCQCVPFFYNISRSQTPICSPTGLACLANTDWYNTSDTRDCMPLCEFSQYLLLPTLHYQHTDNKNTRLLHLSLVFPKSRMVRDVVFTYSQMFGSIGGAAGLFLGCSFISFIELGFLIYENLICK